MPSYFTVKNECENTIVIEKSRFICSMKNIDGEEDAKKFIEKISKKYSLATHNCYAYIADENGQNFKFSDDGEPQGTAGIPILNTLKSKGFCKTVAVVTRFFGGIKLGVGGLARAYSCSVQECIKNSAISNMKPSVFLSLTFSYDEYARFSKINDSSFAIVDTDFSDNVKIKIAIIFETESVNRIKSKLSDMFSGKNVIESELQGYFDFAGKVCQK